MNIFTTDHPITSRSPCSDPKEHPFVSFVCSVLLLAPLITPFVIWRLYVYLTSDMGAEGPPPDPCLALASLIIFAFAVSLICAVPLVLLYRLSARCWKRWHAAQLRRTAYRRPIATTLVLLLAGLFLAPALAQDVVSLESLSPNLPANAPMVWQVPSNQIPRSLGIYTNVPTIFPVPVLSNAIRLASLPMPRNLTASTNMLRVSDSDTELWSRSLDVMPLYGQLGYRIRGEPTNPTNVPTAAEVTQLAWQYARLLGLNTAELFERPQSRRELMCEYGAFTNHIGAIGTFLTRKIGGLEMRDYGLDVEFGAHKQVRRFTVLWPTLKLAQTVPTATPQQIMQSIRARKTPLAMLEPEGTIDRATLAVLEKTRTLVVTKVKPTYAEGRYGKGPSNGPDQVFTPYAEVEATAQVDDTNLHIRLMAPILAQDATLLTYPTSPASTPNRRN
jgi:hypothetical protein